jgi:hypothetical protein
LKVQFFTALADPTLEAGGVAVDQGIIGYIFAYYGSGTDHGVLADGVPADDGGIGTNGGSFFYECRLELIFAFYKGPGVDDVGKYHGWPQEYVIFANYSTVDGHVILDFDVIAQNYPGCYDHILTNVAVGTQLTAVHQMAEVPDFGSPADMDVFIYIAGLVNEVFYRESSSAPMYSYF